MSDHLIKSYGVTTSLFGLLEQLEILKLQQLDKRMYNSGVSRVQAALVWPKKYKDEHYLAYAYGGVSKHTLFVLDNALENWRKHVDGRFDFSTHRAVHFRNAIISVKFGEPLETTLYDNPTEKETMKIVELDAVPFGSHCMRF